MNCIESVTISGFKKFQQLNVQFNENINILVGENEAGKSTLLEAIKIVLNQQYRNADKSVLKELLNNDDIKHFLKAPSIKTLPQISIVLRLLLDSKHKNAEYFYGKPSEKIDEGYGIIFECKFDEELGAGLEGEIEQGKMPLEYYSLSWKTFAGHPYQIIKRPLGFLFIDTSSTSASTSFNYYNRTLFSNTYDDSVRTSAKNEFRSQLATAFSNLKLPNIEENRKFGIDDKKVILESILSVYEDGIALENKGSGMESLIKTQIALNKKATHLDCILIEEPENHLSYVNLRKMLKAIENQTEDSQLIIATHSNLIASRLNLKNVIWIADNHAQSLSKVDKNVADFFAKADDNGFLQLLLSKKTILVEGATEYLLLPYLYEQHYGKTIEEAGITIIACHGISYHNYLAIAKETDKRIAVITDNDQDRAKVDNAKSFNKSAEKAHIFMSDDLKDGWTWEACIYAANQNELNSLIKVKKDAQYLFHEKDYGQVLGKMLNNKVEIAYQMLTSGKQYVIPQYVEEAFEWINE